MSDTAIITVKNIGKKYNITHQRGGYVTLRDVLANALKNPFGFIFSKAKEVAGLNKKEEFWALKDINFSIQKGEVVGVIGRNGAGKSTLLKILSQITPPTTGEIRINGTVGSLLEVGTGFHPELSGRENIFLNGAILGMKKREIVKKFDDIVKFAGIDKFIDTPVKYYSSGMYVRLAFSVAAHMETDVLIIDEVLAVGDADFQKKCLGKMEDITQKEGRTILFVSHNMTAIERLCKRSVWLEKGTIKSSGETQKVIREYLGQNNNIISNKWVNNDEENKKDYFELKVFEIVKNGNDLYIRIEANIERIEPKLIIGYAIYAENMELLYWSYQADDANKNKVELKVGKNILQTKIPIEILNNGKYSIELIGSIHGQKWFFEPTKGNPTLYVEIDKKFDTSPLWVLRRPGLLAPVIKWERI